MLVKGLTCQTPSDKALRIRDVWQHNLDDEFKLLRETVDVFPFVALDTEFPGVVARPVRIPECTAEYSYQTLR